MKRTVIFDLDGTLVDIEPIFFKIFNALARQFGFPPILPDEIPNLKKVSLKKLIFKRLGFRVFLFPWIIRRGREEYHKLIPEVALFPGIQELFAGLRAKGYHIGIVSSSREDIIHALTDRHHLSVDFIYHSGLFNKAAALKKVIAVEHLTPGETVYVGDEVRDVEACKQAGIPIVAVTWGLNSKEALQQAGAETVDTRESLFARLLR